MGSLAIGLGAGFQNRRSHALTLSFDDGFKKSFYKIADIFEKFGLPACLNIVASGHLPEFIPPDAYIKHDMLGCTLNGSGNIDQWVEQHIEQFLTSKGGWLILNTHGLDKEGWGPMSSNYLEQLLQRLVKVDYLEVLPTGAILNKYGA